MVSQRAFQWAHCSETLTAALTAALSANCAVESSVLQKVVKMAAQTAARLEEHLVGTRGAREAAHWDLHSVVPTADRLAATKVHCWVACLVLLTVASLAENLVELTVCKPVETMGGRLVGNLEVLTAGWSAETTDGS